MTEIIYPTLDLFLYDLRSGLGESEAEIERSRQSFSRKLPEELRTEVFKQDSTFDVEYTELLQPRNKRFKATRDSKPLEGYHYPVRLGDSYGLLLDCSIDNQTEPQPAISFTILKQEIQAKLNKEQPTLGQTWLISAIVPNLKQQNPTKIARYCYEALIPEGNWNLELGERQGEFLGGKIFETQRYRLVLKEGTNEVANIQSIQDSHHVVIILYPDATAARKAAKFYSDWMRLFYYRHKILWCYGQSRLLKSRLSNYFINIQASLKLLRQEDKQSLDLQNLQTTLGKVQDTLTPYTIDLSLLDFQSQTIETNLVNYNKRLQRIIKKGGSESNLEFLQEFSTTATDNYLVQIQQDRTKLEKGLSLLDTSIRTLGSQVEVEKAKNQKLFQTLVSFWGLTVTVYGTVARWLEKLFVLEAREQVLFSALTTAIAMIIFARVYVWWQKRS